MRLLWFVFILLSAWTIGPQIYGASSSGVSQEEIRIGVALPPAGFSGMDGAVKALLEAYAMEENTTHGRNLRFVFMETPMDPTKRADSLLQFLNNTDVFALAASFAAGWEKELADIAKLKKIPVLAAFSTEPQVSQPLNPYVFYMESGMIGQMRVLARFASERLKESKSGMIYLTDAAPLDAMKALEEEHKRLGMSPPTRLPWMAEEFAGQYEMLAGAGYDLLYMLTPLQESLLMLNQDVSAGPYVMGPSRLAEKRLLATPTSMQVRIVLATPHAQPSPDSPGVLKWKQMAEKHDLSSAHQAAQYSVLASVKLLMEGLELAGNELTQEKLIQALESLNQFETGLSPPVSYGPNRRVGVAGSVMISPDSNRMDFRYVSGWIDP